MPIDIIFVAPKCDASVQDDNAAPVEDSCDASAFAALLDDAAEEPDASALADEGDAVPFDGWATVVVPFMPPVVTHDDVPWSLDIDGSSEPAIDNEQAADAPVDAEPAIETSPVAVDVPDLEPWIPKTDVVRNAASDEAPVAETEPETRMLDAAAPPAVTATERAVGVAEPAAPDVQAANEPVAKATDGARARARVPANHTSTHIAGAASSPSGEPSKAPARVSDAVAEVPQPESRPASEPSAEQATGLRGAAARLARALERASEAAPAVSEDAATSDAGQQFTPGGDSQPSLGEWLRERLVNQGSGVLRQSSAGAPVFNVAAPVHGDPRVGATLATAGVPQMAGAPALPSEQDVAAQLVQSLRLQFRDGIGEAVLKLKPEHLGSVSIALRVENGGLKANVQADVPVVRHWLESQQDTLRNALAEHGLRLDRFVVDSEQHRQASSEDRPNERSPRRRQQRRAPQAEQPVFEVVV